MCKSYGNAYCIPKCYFPPLYLYVKNESNQCKYHGHGVDWKCWFLSFSSNLCCRLQFEIGFSKWDSQIVCELDDNEPKNIENNIKTKNKPWLNAIKKSCHNVHVIFLWCHCMRFNSTWQCMVVLIRFNVQAKNILFPTLLQIAYM